MEQFTKAREVMEAGMNDIDWRRLDVIEETIERIVQVAESL